MSVSGSRHTASPTCPFYMLQRSGRKGRGGRHGQLRNRHECPNQLPTGQVVGAFLRCVELLLLHSLFKRFKRHEKLLASLEGVNLVGEG
jgi:hypothetical protein